MYIINKIGDNTPPCFTPLVTGKWLEIKLSQFTLIHGEMYILARNLATVGHR